MSSRFRVAADDFPSSTTAVAVEWPEAGVVFFVDVCRSHLELSPPSVWMLDQPSTYEDQPTEIMSLQVAPTSANFRCSYFVPKIVKNVLLLFCGDTIAPRTSSSPQKGNNNNSSISTIPFFGVCASLLPPAELVRQHGIDAFAAFSFAWLCGPEIQSMRPPARVGFACSAVLLPRQQHSQQQLTPNVSVWIHGGMPLVPTTVNQQVRLATSTSNNNSHHNRSHHQHHHYEPLTLIPDQQQQTKGNQNNNDGDYHDNNNNDVTDTFLLFNDQHTEKHLRRAVSEDFYGMFELKLSIVNEIVPDQSYSESGAVSVWPWIRHPGLPVITSHSLAPVLVPQKQNATRNNQNNHNNKNKLFLVVFGGLRLDSWRSQRSDLLPPFKHTEFNISNTFYIYDTEEETWEWKDALIGSMTNENSSDSEVAAAMMKTISAAAEKEDDEIDDENDYDENQNEDKNNNDNDFDHYYDSAASSSLSLIGGRPPPVFDHKLIHLQPHPILFDENGLERNGGQEDNDSHIMISNSFLVCGGLRGRFTEKSKEIWSFATKNNRGSKILRCAQLTGPPTEELSNHIFCLFDRLWVVDFKKKRMYHRQNNISASTSSASSSSSAPWEGPVSIVSRINDQQSRRGRSIDLDNPPPTVVHISHHSPQRQKNQQQQNQQGEGDNQNQSQQQQGVENNNNNEQNADATNTYKTRRSDFEPDENQQQQQNASPRSSAIMDAFEF